MEKLLLLYLGCVFLMYLSQLYYPVKYHLQGRQGSRANFWLEKSDIFMAVAIFGFLRSVFFVLLIMIGLRNIRDKNYFADI